MIYSIFERVFINLIDKLPYLSEITIVLLCHLSDDVGEAGVTQQQPAAGRDAVSLVLELVWVHLKEVLEPDNRRGNTYSTHTWCVVVMSMVETHLRS